VSFGMIRLSALSGVFILIAGCGGSAGGGSGSGGSGGGGGGGSPTTVTFRITGGSPAAVATQTGSGAFTAATLSSNSLTLNLPSGTTNFAVAWVCPPTNIGTATSPMAETDQYVDEASTLDGTSFSVSSCGGTTPSSGATGTLTGSVDASAISGTQYLELFAANGAAFSWDISGVPSGSFSFLSPVGTDRVVVADYGSTQQLLAVKNISSQTVPGVLNGGSTVVLSAADQTVQEPITYQNVPAGFAARVTNVYYFWNGGSDLLIVANGVASSYPALPAGAMESGDYYDFTAIAALYNERVLVHTTSTSGAPVSFSFPPAWSYAGPAAAKWPSFNVDYTGFSGAANVCSAATIAWYPSSTAENDVWVNASGNYLAESKTMVIPDLSNLTGFIATPASNSAVVWAADVSQGDSSCFQSNSLSNMTEKAVSNAGTYTVP